MVSVDPVDRDTAAALSRLGEQAVPVYWQAAALSPRSGGLVALDGVSSRFDDGRGERQSDGPGLR